MPLRWLKIGKRWLSIMAFPDSISIQEVFPKIGLNISYPWEPWMKYLTKPSLYPLS